MEFEKIRYVGIRVETHGEYEERRMFHEFMERARHYEERQERLNDPNSIDSKLLQLQFDHLKQFGKPLEL